MAPPLNVASLIEEAVARDGSAATAGAGAAVAAADPPFVENLELLVESCGETGRLNRVGWEVLHKVAVRHVRNLLYLGQYVDAHPEVAGRDLGTPVVITGLPRTGTTLLHNLLALDPAHRVLRFWEGLHPIPPDGGGPSVDDLQAQAARWLDAFHRLVPGFRAIHPATATGPEECDALLQNTFASQHFDDMFDAEEYSHWLAHARLGREYVHYALQLRVLSGASTADRRWVLKSPSHLGHLDALLGALPDCTVVVCHRDPSQAVASYASLIFTLRRAYSDAVEPSAVGRQALERAATAVRRALEVRDRLESAGSAFVDVAYHDLVAEPLAAVQKLYEAVGRPLEAPVAARMCDWLVANPQHKHGPHRYGLADFGLTAAEVDAALAS